jgi:hypothetical protein
MRLGDVRLPLSLCTEIRGLTVTLCFHNFEEDLEKRPENQDNGVCEK